MVELCVYQMLKTFSTCIFTQCASVCLCVCEIPLLVHLNSSDRAASADANDNVFQTNYSRRE